MYDLGMIKLLTYVIEILDIDHPNAHYHAEKIMAPLDTLTKISELTQIRKLVK